METYLDNLSRIKAAWAMGYSTRARCLENGLIGRVYGFCEHADGSSNIGWTWETCVGEKNEIQDLDEIEITGYLYAGQLAGDKEPESNQLFKVKETGEIKKWGEWGCPGYLLDDYHISEIEPVFD